MDICIGELYKSSTNGRYIQVLGFEEITEEFFYLNINWIDRDTFQVEPDTLKILKSKTRNWTKVDLNV